MSKLFSVFFCDSKSMTQRDSNNKLCSLCMGGHILPKMSQSISLLYIRIAFTPWWKCLVELAHRDPSSLDILSMSGCCHRNFLSIPKWKLLTKRENILTLSICKWITKKNVFFFSRLQGDVVRFWCCMWAGPGWPLQGRVRLQESGMSIYSGACLRLGFVYLLQRVRARKSPVQRTATHQGATEGTLL